MEEVTVKVFPQNDIEALAMLYVRSQDLSDITPEELLDMYDSAYETMVAVRNKQHESGFNQA